MQRLSLLIIFQLFIFTTVFGQIDHPNLTYGTLQSESLRKEMSYYVYTPTTGDSEERFPVIYLLHGKTQTHEAWLKYGKAATFADNYRSILVFVGGAKYSWYLDSPRMEDSQFFSYITEDLIQHIDTTYPTVAKKEGRSIMGLSMGGHGALLAAAKRPDLFVSASSMSGVLKITDHPDRESLVDRLGPLEHFPQRWAENSVYEHAEKFKDANVALLFDCGEDDTTRGILYDNQKMHARLKELGVPHIWRELAGDHNWRYWRGRLPEHLNFHQAHMCSVQNQKKWVQHYFMLLKDYLEQSAEFELQDFDDDTIRVSMFGSSGIEGMKPEFLPEALPDGRKLMFVNRGIGSDRLGIDERGLSKRMESSVFDFEPHVVVIANGTNDIGELSRSDVGHPSIERMLEEYQYIVSTIQERQPETKIIIVACSPTRGRYAKLNDWLVQYNAGIKAIAEKENATYVDIHSLVADEEGLLKEEYSTDGLHYTPEAKTMWVNAVVYSIAEALGSANEVLN